MQPMVTITSDPRIGFSARLADALDAIDFPREGSGRQKKLAETAGVSQQAAGKWLRGESLPELTKAISIAYAANVTVEWLLTGRGPRNVLRADQLVRMNETGDIELLTFEDGMAGGHTRGVLVAAEPVGAYEVIRQDPALLIDVLRAALGVLGLSVVESSSIDRQSGLSLKARWSEKQASAWPAAGKGSNEGKSLLRPGEVHGKARRDG